MRKSIDLYGKDDGGDFFLIFFVSVGFCCYFVSLSCARIRFLCFSLQEGRVVGAPI